MTVWFVSQRGAIHTERGILKFRISSRLVICILDPTVRVYWTAMVLKVVYLLRVLHVF
jgi:hypothetical protein